MATGTSAVTNELVMGDEEIQAELSNTDDTPVETVPDATDSEEDIPETWMDKEEGDETSEDAEEAPAAQAKKPAQSVRKYKANGQDVEVDHADTERVDQLITLGLGARQAFSERDKLRKSVGTKDKELADLKPYKELWDKIEASKGDHDGLYEKVFGKKFSEVVDAEVQRRAAYEAATPEERKLLDYERRIAEVQRRLDEQQKSWEAKEKDADQRSAVAQQREVRAQMMPEFHKHEFSTKVDDPVLAEKLNAMLWRNTVANLKKAYGEKEQIPQEAIKREFQAVAELLGGAKVAKKEVSKVVAEKKQQAQVQAQNASTRNYTKPDTSLAKEKDPVKLWRKMFK